MFSEPTFDGFRLSLSEKSRLVYCNQKPESWSEKIDCVKYSNEKIDIDVKFCSGLNVVIGGSSSGKTLLVDSIWRKLSHTNFDDSHYNSFDVENLNVVNPSGIHPHYLGQNYIMKVVGDEEGHNIEVNAVNSYGVPMHIVYDATPTTGIENVGVATFDVEKKIDNGQLLIIRNGKVYNALGAQVK